jgi:hypothetical protein
MYPRAGATPGARNRYCNLSDATPRWRPHVSAEVPIRYREEGCDMLTVNRSEELEEFAREGRRRFEAGDQPWFEQTTAHGEVSSFGTAPDEQARGREAVLALTMEQIREMNAAAGLTIDADEGTVDEDAVEAYQAGDAGWIVTHGRFTFEDGSWAANRVVTVVIRDTDSGGWKSVLTASQLLVPNELLLPGSPLRSPST